MSRADSGALNRTDFTCPVAIICLLLGADFFLLNRFDVPYSIVIDGWRIDPVSILAGLTFVGLALFLREQPRPKPSLPERVSFWVFLAWITTGFISTAVQPRVCSPNYGGLACLGTIVLWTLPAFVLPALRLSKGEIILILLAYLVLSVVGVLANVCLLLMPGWVSPLVGWEADRSFLRAFLPLGVSTVLGCVFAMGIPLAIGLYYRLHQYKGARSAAIVTCVLLVIGALTCGSRGGTAVTLIALAGSVGIMGRPAFSSRTVKVGGAAVLIAVLFGVFLLRDRSRLVSLYDGSIEWRKRGAAVAVRMVEDYPFLGTGIEHYFRRSSTGKPSYLFSDHGMEVIVYRNRLTAREPHNLYLLTAAETGFPGLVFLLVFLGSTLWIPLRSARTSSDVGDSALLLGMAVSISIVLLQSITESMLLARPRFAILAGILWGAFRRCARVSEKSEKA